MKQTVCFAKCERYDPRAVEQGVERILAQYGGAEAFLKKGRRVVIKPNLLLARDPELATTTHPSVVEAAARAFVRAGAQVTIAESGGGPYNAVTMQRAYAACGMEAAAQASGAVLNRDPSHRTVTWGERRFQIITPVAEADVVVSIAKLKTHMLTRYTGAVKNLFGTVAGLSKAEWHARLPGVDDFSEMLVDLCQCVAPDLSIIDGVVGMDGKGPSGGRARQAGVLIGSTDPYAADLAAMWYCGIDPGQAPVHRAAQRRGLAADSGEELELAGDPVQPLAEPFLPPVALRRSHSWLNYLPRPLREPLRKRIIPYPEFTRRCVGCGKCAQGCPQGAITLSEGRARLDRARCIQCYCCHELCPVRAVDIKD